MTETYFGATDTGRLRNNNEDAFFVQPVLNNGFIAACVIDGVGGYEGGEVAARIAHDAILDYFRIPSGEIMVMMKEALVSANEKIFQEKKRNPHLHSMACVLTLALVDTINNQFYYAHVGDTRLYLLRDDTLVKVTKDQSFVGFLEESGRLSEEAAMRHPKRNEINKALGFEPFGIHSDYIETGSSPFLPGDTLLLCSDGLSDLVSSREITALLLDDTSLAEKCRALIDAANEAGGKDNITVVLVQNSKEPVKQKATKPKKPKVAAVKKNSSPQAAAEEGAEIIAPPMRAKPKKNNQVVLILVLSFLCLLFLSAFIWLWWQKGNSEEETTTAVISAPVVKTSNAQEQLLWDSLNRPNSKTLTLHDSLFGKTITLSDTLFLQKDSLHLKGNGVVLQADSAFSGPAFSIPASVQYLLLDSMVLQNFDVAILTQSKKVRLKNVRFQNCRVPVQYQLLLHDSTSVSGTLSDILNRNNSTPR